LQVAVEEDDSFIREKTRKSLTQYLVFDQGSKAYQQKTMINDQRWIYNFCCLL
jgi:hypothetical protein